MSPRAPRKCPAPGCINRITSGRYCPEHTVHHWTNGKSRTSDTEHRRWAAAILERDHHRCQIRGPKCTGRADVADHIIPDAEGGPLTLANGQAACMPCHKAKTAQEAARGLRRAFGTPERPQRPLQ